MTIPTYWTEDYRPQTFDEYVWRDPVMKAKVREWIDKGAVPHLLLSGKSGLGKSSLAWMILNELKVPKIDILDLNASRERKIGGLEEKIMGFISTYPEWNNPHGIKYVLLEEADSLSFLSQKFLRSELERNIGHVRFIFTCNYREKLETAIIGRCQEFNFIALDQEEFVQKLIYILDCEKVTYEVSDLVDYVDAAYPDLRKCIGLMETNTVGGVLNPIKAGEGRDFDYLLEVRDMFLAGKHKQARELMVNQTNVDQYPEVFRYLYQNLDLWSTNPDSQDRALVIIRDGIWRHATIADPEINLSATIVELVRLDK